MSYTIKMLESRHCSTPSETLYLEAGRTYTTKQVGEREAVSMIRNGYAQKMLAHEHHVLTREVYINPTAMNRCLLAMLEGATHA